MSVIRELPSGYVRRDSADATWICDGELEPALRQAGLASPAGWASRLRDARGAGPGRGASVRLELARGRAVVLKALRRGGLVGPLWRDRFVGIARLVDNVVVAYELHRHGVSTPLARALLIVHGPPGLHRGWLAVDALDGDDLVAIAARSVDAAADALRPTLRTVRAAHDVGLRHPDLNLGNLFLTRDGSGHLIDLDGARLGRRRPSIGRRFRELLRLERSWLRRVGDAGGDAGRRILEAYAGDDRELARRLAALRPLGRVLLRLRGAHVGGAW